MKINNKQMAITLVSALVLISVYAYSVRGMPIINDITGQYILRDQRWTREEFADINDETFSNIINLPTSNCVGTVNYCSVTYKSGINANADINKDGKIDATDANILAKAFGCGSGQACWTRPLDQCYFSASGRKFKDPTRDCKFDSSDQTLITANMGKSHTLMGSPSCDSNDVCKSDISQDGVVDIIDAIITSNFYGKNADTFDRLANSQSQADLNGDNTVDILDAITMANNYGKDAIEQRCSGTTSLTYISGNKYSASLPTMKAPYYISVSFSCR